MQQRLGLARLRIKNAIMALNDVTGRMYEQFCVFLFFLVSRLASERTIYHGRHHERPRFFLLEGVFYVIDLTGGFCHGVGISHSVHVGSSD